MRIAVAGFGAVGEEVAKAIDAGVSGAVLTAVSASRRARTEAAVEGFKCPVPVLPLERLGEVADVIVECVPASVFRGAVVPALRQGATVVVVSAGALVKNWDVVELAKESGARIHVASGALLGLDAVCAAAEGVIHNIEMITRKPTKGLLGAPFLERSGIDLNDAPGPVKLFEGNPIEAIEGFPANLNVSVALGLAAGDLKKVRLEIWADPQLTRNTHKVNVESDSATFSMEIQNVPSDQNPRTGKITAHSVVALLRKACGTLAIGT